MHTIMPFFVITYACHPAQNHSWLTAVSRRERGWRVVVGFPLLAKRCLYEKLTVRFQPVAFHTSGGRQINPTNPS